MFPVESFRATLEKFQAIADQCGIRYHVTGGIIGNVIGEPRMTQDIDIVVDPVETADHVVEFIALLATSDFEFHEPSIRTAIADGTMFQLFDASEALKLDIYPRELIAGELDRSVVIELFDGFAVPIVSLVDAAISKLIWIDKGSHKSRRELRAIVRKLDDRQLATLHQVCDELGLSNLLLQVLSESDELE